MVFSVGNGYLKYKAKPLFFINFEDLLQNPSYANCFPIVWDDFSYDKKMLYSGHVGELDEITSAQSLLLIDTSCLYYN